MTKEKLDRRLDAILKMVQRIAALDFSLRLKISDKADNIDAIASGLNMLSEELEATLAERERSQDEMRQQHETLAHLQRVATMGELIGTLGHEFSQPLTAILSNAPSHQTVSQQRCA